MKIRIFVEKEENDFRGPSTKPFGWVVKASNGDLPEEGYVHATRKDAVKAIYAMYAGQVWNLRVGGGFWIETE